MSKPFNKVLSDEVDEAAELVKKTAETLIQETDDPHLERAAGTLAKAADRAADATTELTTQTTAGQTAAAALEDELEEAAKFLMEAMPSKKIPAGTADTYDLETELEEDEQEKDTKEEAAALLGRAKSTDRAVAELQALAKMKAARSVQLSTLFKIFCGACIALELLIITKWNYLSTWALYAGALIGGCMGMFMTAAYYLNRKLKAEQNARLAMIPGAKGMQTLLHQIPTWISFSETEKMEWMNSILMTVWPYYDEAICAMVKKEVEPLLNYYKPPGIKEIYFQRLSFGDAPFRVEGIRVDRTSTDHIQIETDFRWAGQSSIFLAIQLAYGGALTRMVPKVADMAVSGTARIILKPLLPEIPGFGAAVVSLMKTPVIKFHLDFGAAFGGSMSANAIRSWLDPFIRNQLAAMFVWPNRMVVPILGPEITGPLHDLYERHQGALQVDVIRATDIPKMDTLGSADPFVEMYTQLKYLERTTVKKNTRTPTWNERLWVLVQEPATQAAKVTVNDVDAINLKELFKFNVVKGATNIVNAPAVIGRCLIKIAEFADQPGVTMDKVFPLGLGDHDDEDGCGGGRGSLHLKITYWPFELIDWHPDAAFGAIIVTLIKCSNLPAADIGGFSDPYVKFLCNGEKEQSMVKYATLNPQWDPDSKFDWFRIPQGEDVKVEVYDYDRFSGDDILGSCVIKIHDDVAVKRGGDVTRKWQLSDLMQGWQQKVDSGEVEQPTITMRVQWVPFK